MHLKGAVGLGLLALTAVAVAQQVAQPTSRARGVSNGAPAAEAKAPAPRQRPRQQAAAPGAGRQAGQLIPRRPFPKTPTEQLAIPDLDTGRLIVKFVDEVKARSGTRAVQSASGYDLAGFNAIIDRFGLSVRCALSPPLEKLAEIEARAAAHSGVAQPDLAGMTYVEGADGVPMAAAAALNNLDYVEFVEYEQLTVPKQLGACCLVSNHLCIEDLTLQQCTDAGGVWLGDGSTCGGPQCAICCLADDACVQDVSPDWCSAAAGAFIEGEYDCTTFDCSEVDEPDCGVPITGDCFDPGNGTPYCLDELCCLAVCEVDPFCCDDTLEVIWPGRDFSGVGHWDPWCADHALELCSGDFDGGNKPANPVFNPLNPTENLSDAQGYMTANGWTDPPEANIRNALRYNADGYDGGVPGANLLDGFSGEGFSLQGLWDIGEILIDSGLADENLTRGATIKIGVIETAAFVDNALGPDAPYQHEDLDGKVITETEPGNRFLIIPGSSQSTGDHGTATLGIIGAIDHDAAGNPVSGLSPAASLAEEVGMVGMAPDAELYFFSDATVGGGGLIDAIGRALAVGFGPGDVLSFSIGPGGCGTVNNMGGAATLVSVATSLGITSCLAAGNDCCNLDTVPWNETGAIVVGACYPGVGPVFNQYCRLPFSNSCQGCAEGPVGRTRVDTSAWGEAVATLGYGDLFIGASNNIHNRSYTNTFGGTSAAAPMIASLVASLQGLSKMMWGIPLSPVTIRSIISGHGFTQCGFLSSADVPGSAGVDGFGCTENTWIYSHGDWDMGENANLIALPGSNVAFTSAFRCGEEIIKGGFFDGNPLVDELEILVGYLLFGNVFSIKASDETYLVIASEFMSPSGPGVSDRGDIITGDMTDVLIRAHADVPAVTDISIFAETYVTGGSGVMLVWLYSFDFSRWLVAGVAFVDDTPDVVYQFPIGNAAQFVRSSDDAILIRVQTVSQPFMPDYQVYHDWIGVGVTGNPFIPSPGG
jgi:hypothetical protein